MFRGRYQASLEFLTTYGWAVAVILIVLAVLYSMGIFSISSSMPNSISGFLPLGVPSAVANSTLLMLDIENGVGQPINITGIVVNTSGISYTTFSCNSYYLYSNQGTVCSIPAPLSDPAYISAEIVYKIPTNRNLILSATGKLVLHLQHGII